MFKFGEKVNKNLQDLIHILPQKGSVLDLGCGMGANSDFLQNAGFNVTCVEKDSIVIEELRKKNPKINVIESDILNFNFPTEKYDLILILNVLHFFNVAQIKQITSNMIRSLKKDGLIYMQVFSVKDPAYKKMSELGLKIDEKNTFLKKKTKSFMHFFEKNELENLFLSNKILELDEFLKQDNHPPQGEHSHSIIKMLIKKL